MIRIFRIDSMRVPWGIVMMAMASVFLASNTAAQNVITDQVAITSGQGKLFGLTPGEGIAREILSSGEDVLVIEAKGVTGFVQTTIRLLGFSGRLNRWVDLTLPTGEQIIKWEVMSRMIVVQGRKAAYGFQSDRGRWKRESWGAGESLQNIAVKADIAVMVTNRRALGFSAFTGGFFPQDLPAGNQIQEIEINDNVVILHLNGFMLVFRSGLAIWAELP
jgi:hypothetical protein